MQPDWYDSVADRSRKPCANGQAEKPKAVLLRVAHQSNRLSYHEYIEGQRPLVLDLDSTGIEGVASFFAFSHMSGFTPIQMDVQRASNLRGEIPARVCLLGRDKAMYKTYAIPEDLIAGGCVAG